MTGRKKLLIATVVWGDWYVGALVDCAVPSLLSPNNFPRLARDCDLEFLVMTRPAEQPRIESSPAIQLARKFMTVHVLPGLPPVIDSTVNVFNFHHMMWNFVYERAKREGSYVFNLSPDAVFADGAGTCWADLIARGQRAILWTFPRGLDTAMPILRDRYRTPDGAINISPRELVSLNLQHLHPLSKALQLDSPNFPNFPEMLLWPVPGEGLLMRILAGEPRVFNPSQVELTPQQIVAGTMDGCTFIDDSDVLYTMSLTPAGHNADWYKQPAKADSGKVGRWWLDFDSPTNDSVAARQICVHPGDRTEALWRARERRANLFVSRAAASREFLRVARAAFAADCTWVAALLTMIGRTTAGLRLFPGRMQTLIFGPTDAAIASLSIGELLKPAAAARLARLLRSHVVIDDRPELNLTERVHEAGGILRLRSLAGRELTVARRPDGWLMLDRFKLAHSQIRTRGHTFIPVDGVLDEDVGRALA